MTPPPDRDGPGAPTKSPKSAAERMRRYRARQTEGVKVYRIEAVPGVKQMLVKIGFMTKEEAQDRRRVAAALEGFVDCLARGELDLEKLSKAQRVSAGLVCATGTTT